MRIMFHHIVTLFATLLMMPLSGCIHTYPDGEGSDPSLVQAGIVASFDINWETFEMNLTKANEKACRLTIEITRSGSLVGRCIHYISAEDYSKGNVKLILPFNLHAVSYKISAWLDFVDYEDNRDLYYDIADFSEIRRSDNHISWGEDANCATANTTVNLQEYKDQWGAKAIITLKLTTPLGRFQIIATDIEKFLDFVAESIKRGETYSICLAFENRIARGFNAYENEISGYLESPEYYFQLPAAGDVMTDAAVFSDDDETFLKAKVLVYNSARIIVSKSPSIQFPIQRGKLTVIRGDMLTDYYNNSINVNNIWDGEIIIEI